MRRRRFARFLVVGGIGFLADAGALALLLAATPLDPYSAAPPSPSASRSASPG